MRTYKTWEVVKMLNENPKLRFEAKIYKDCTVAMWIDKNDGDLLANEIKSAPDFPCTNKEWLNAKWTLVKTPVTWQEALQALIDGERVKCICDVDFCDFNDNCCYFSLNQPDMCIHGLKHGQWFIVPEGVDE
jgi:hypothetical protein